MNQKLIPRFLTPFTRVANGSLSATTGEQARVVPLWPQDNGRRRSNLKQVDHDKPGEIGKSRGGAAEESLLRQVRAKDRQAPGDESRGVSPEARGEGAESQRGKRYVCTLCDLLLFVYFRVGKICDLSSKTSARILILNSISYYTYIM